MADPKRKAKGRAGGGEEAANPAAAKPAAANPGAQKSSAPKVSRPQIPAVYGLPKHNKGLLPWSHVSERMAQARVYWITTVDPGGRPHATPVVRYSPASAPYLKNFQHRTPYGGTRFERIKFIRCPMRQVAALF
jgi:hypothetical protein